MSIRGSRPKLQKMIEEETEDQEAVGRLLELSEVINADLEKYDKLRKGDYEGASQVTVKPISAPTRTSNGGPISLIDFDAELGGHSAPPSSKNAGGSGNLIDDLAGLSFQSEPFGQKGSISLGHDTSKFSTVSPLTIGMFSSSPSNTPARVASPSLHSPQNKPSTPDYSAFAALQNMASSRTTSPPSQSYQAPAYNPPVVFQSSPAVADDDFGTFASAVPDVPPASIIFNSANLSISLEARTQQPGNITLTARFTNKLPVRIDELTFQLAVPKVSIFHLMYLTIVNEIDHESTVFKIASTHGEGWDNANIECFGCRSWCKYN